jgi:hypothetical protein
MESETSSHKILVILPNVNDRAEARKLDSSKYEVHFLHATDHYQATFEYTEFLAQPSFLISCVDRAVRYVKENAITAIMFGHDLSSIVASVVCQITGLRGPSLISTFVCLHKYYSRKACEDNLWMDYINLDDPVEIWRNKMKYPCFLKPPFLTQSKGMSVIRNEPELVAAIAKVRSLVAPFFQAYRELFQKYLDLDQFPLAVQNIMIVEELIESLEEFALEGWVDNQGNFFALQSSSVVLSPKKRETILGYVMPMFSETEGTALKMAAFVQEVVTRFCIRNTCINVDIWKCNEGFLLVEVNCRCVSIASQCEKKVLGASAYEIAVHVACGDFVALEKIQPRLTYEDGLPITGIFRVYTWGEGKADKIFNLNYARNGSIQDGTFNNAGPGAVLLVSENSQIKQLSSGGYLLAYFMVVENNLGGLFARVKLIVDKLLFRQCDRDMATFPTA